jgi:hypothetical protein
VLLGAVQAPSAASTVAVAAPVCAPCVVHSNLLHCSVGHVTNEYAGLCMAWGWEGLDSNGLIRTLASYAAPVAGAAGLR